MSYRYGVGVGYGDGLFNDAMDGSGVGLNDAMGGDRLGLDDGFGCGYGYALWDLGFSGGGDGFDVGDIKGGRTGCCMLLYGIQRVALVR